MFTFDNTAIILSATLVILALLTSLLNPFLRKVRISEHGVSASVTDTEETKDADDTAGEAVNTTEEVDVISETACTLPSISIIFTPHDNAGELTKYLPFYLNQNYPADFQVIVVAPQNDHETSDVLKRFADNPHLYTTFIPDSSRYMSKKKLAVTLGVKAAKHDWVIMADICCRPMSENWLMTIASNCTEGKELVVGYTRYEDETPDYRHFERYYQARYFMREYQHHKAYGCPFNALIFRKSIFLKREGFRGNLKYLRGEYDFMVNKYAKGDNLVLENSPEGTLIEETPTEKVWLGTHLFYMENRQHMERTAQHRFLPYLDQTALHGNYLLQCIALIVALLIGQWTIAAAAGLALLLSVTLRLIIGKKALRRFNIDIPAWKIIPYEIAVAWKHLGYRIKYHRANKYDFISHKL
ncbi:MAG: glycosyl transferase family 2 [Prevotella fusca]